MFRKLSQGQRLSSPLKRLSSLKFELDDKNSRAAGEGKRSLIPRFTSRSSSVERDECRRSSARLTGTSSRSTSTERASGGASVGPSHFRSRSTENLCSPRFAAKTPSGTVCKGAPGSRTVGKDKRPLTDRAFQNLELSKVQQYLVCENIVAKSQVREVRNPMTTKSFVTIMNELLMKIFPGNAITLSNYCELIPILMKKIKYPGNINRSWLITANTPHSWPCVLGLMSWLTDWLSSGLTDFKYIEDEVIADGTIVMDSDRVNKFLEYNRKAYVEWSENLEDISPAVLEQFGDELFTDVDMATDSNIVQVQREVDVLEEKKRELDDPEESAAVEKFKVLKELEERNKAKLISLQENVHDLQKNLEKHKSYKQTLKQENEILKEVLADNVCTTIRELSDITKLESEVTSVRNVMKLQGGHITDITNQCYTADITNARLQGKFEEVGLKREAMLKESTSEYTDISDLDFSLKYANKENAEIMEQFFVHLKKKSELLENLWETCSEQEKNVQLQVNEAEEKLKVCNDETQRRQYLLEPLELKLLDIKKSTRSLEKELSHGKKDYIQMKEQIDVLEQTLEKEKTDFMQLEKELTLMEVMLKERKEKYLNILKKLGNMFTDFVKKCEEEAKNLNRP